MRDLTTRAAILGDAARDFWFRIRHPPRRLAHSDATPTEDAVTHAIDRGLRFLATTQRSDGAWIDFHLPPGASVEWITAHVAFVLEGVVEAYHLTHRAASYLAAVGVADGGWGYCRRVANDCDSTAQAVMVLDAHDMSPPHFVVDWLLKSETPSGGFPTYPPDSAATNGWQVSHADVTVVVAEALRRLGVGDDARRRSLRWLDATTNDALVSSYWWPSPAYAAWVQTRCGFKTSDAANSAAALIGRLRSVPDIAMLLSAASVAEPNAERSQMATMGLLAQQLDDGSWPCAPCLRVTDPRHGTTSMSISGPVFAGGRRVFSTAHAVAALRIGSERERS